MTDISRTTRTVSDEELAQQRAYTAKIAAWNEAFFAENNRQRRYFVV